MSKERTEWVNEELLCPYCGERPLRQRKDAKTCGDPECVRLRKNQLMKAYLVRNPREIKEARTELCPYCKERPLNKRKDARTCSHPECLKKHNLVASRRKNRVMWAEQKEAAGIKTETTIRKCLGGCDKDFVSTGNFICESCAERNRGISSDMVYNG